MMRHKGYTAGAVTFDADQGIFHGEVAGLRDVVTFQGRDADELKRAFRDSIDDYLEFCAERGEAPDKPYSGKIMIRSEPELHRRLAQHAAAEGVSVNQLVTETLRRALGLAAPGSSRPIE
jgi:predicted HicB family RNase H-like nuclease